MRWCTDGRYKGGGYWRCRVKHRQAAQAQYERMTGFEYNRRLLQLRRWKALDRRRKRKESLGSLQIEG